MRCRCCELCLPDSGAHGAGRLHNSKSAGALVIGTEGFEVTQAILIGTLGGSAWARGVNDAGQIVGYGFVIKCGG
jgi:hypothetical protein